MLMWFGCVILVTSSIHNDDGLHDLVGLDLVFIFGPTSITWAAAPPKAQTGTTASSSPT
jgi:hypothetical protein